ncbi:MAG: acyl carrier protein [Phaeodactylibacter sp.]|nr:acyl carrier protein [Phaeodactylibacter sp.]MCB9301022.1 acyl carrier protein [Lewinellaceae bacterium]
MESIKGKVREYLVAELNLPISQEELQDDTPLLSSRLIDSISALLLVEFLEKEYKIEFKPHEVNHDNLDSLDLIANFVEGKQQEHA